MHALTPISLALALALAAPAGASAEPAPDPAERFDVAITIDDLPVHGALAEGQTRLDIAKALITALKARRVPEVYGFVNIKGLTDEPGSEAVLKVWRDAGYPLGNHGATHLNLEKAPSIEAWQQDVSAGEPLIADYMKGADWRWYRYPNLAAGSEPVRHDAAAAYLGERGYRVANVSVAFSDWSYTGAYARCRTKGDSAAIEEMRQAYLAAADVSIVRMKAASKRVFGRVVPQVVLLHAGGFTADTLPALLSRLEAAGARFVTLRAVHADPAYRDVDKLLRGGSIIDRTAKAKGVDLGGLPKPQTLATVKSLCR